MRAGNLLNGLLSKRALSSLIRKPAPSFSLKALVNGQFKTISNEDFKGNTFVCPTEILAFNDRLSEFEKLDCEVMAASVDSEFSHLAWSQMPLSQGGLQPPSQTLSLPLISDLNKSLARDYGVLVEDSGFALRGLFIMDKKGVVRHSTVNDTGIGRSVDETLRVLQALQHHDLHGEVCPVNWKPNTPAINPAKAKEYFSSLDPKK